jgi:flagellar L-ring protein FlgH
VKGNDESTMMHDARNLETARVAGPGVATCRAVWLIGACLALVSACGQADSLYTEGSFFSGMFGDRKAAKVGDALQIIIQETASATHTAERNNGVSTSSTIGPGGGKLSFLPLFSYTGSSQSSAKGDASRTETFVGRVTVMVKSIAPNGNLLVEGERTIQVNRDVQKIRLTGEVRPRDVQRDNTVLSSAVANAKIDYEGSDPAKPGSKVGLITGLLHWLF